MLFTNEQLRDCAEEEDMHIWSWTMKSTGGAITVDGKNDKGDCVKVRHIKTVTFEKIIETKPFRWWQKKPRRVVHQVYCKAVDKDDTIHILHIVG